MRPVLVVAVAGFAFALPACGGDASEPTDTSSFDSSLEEGKQQAAALNAETSAVSLQLSCASGQIPQANAWANRIIRAVEKTPEGEEILERIIAEAERECPAEVTAKLEAAAP